MAISLAGQAWDATGYERNARFVSDLGTEVLKLLAPKPDEAILDLGCGDGVLTQRIVATGARVRTTVGAAGSVLVAHAASSALARESDSTRPSAIRTRMLRTREVTAARSPRLSQRPRRPGTP